jgi:SAM-dependent methyltransferase
MQACPVCAFTPARPAFRKDGIKYQHCRKCRFLFARPSFNANLQCKIEEFDSAYLQYLDEDFAGGKDHALVLAWMRCFGFRDHHRLMDLGCGGGKFVRRMRKQNFDARGVEPSAALYERFLKLDPSFELGHVHDVCDKWTGAFDCVTAFDVIEHVEDPASFLRHAAGMLKPSGRLFLSTPDNGSLAALLFGKSWHYYHRFHLSMFSPATLRLLARRVGLRWVSCSRIGRLRSLGYLTRYFFDYVLKRPAPPWVSRLNNVDIPVNFFDTMNVCLARPSARRGEGRRA